MDSILRPLDNQTEKCKYLYQKPKGLKHEQLYCFRPQMHICLETCSTFFEKNYHIPSNAHILTPFFQKTVFFSKISFGKPPSNSDAQKDLLI